MIDRSFLTNARFQVDPAVFITAQSDCSSTIINNAPLPTFCTGSYHYHSSDLPDDFVPGPKDIVTGRGKVCYNHPGNTWFKDIIASNLVRYACTKTKMDKSLVVNDIVDDIQEQSPSGGFVKKVKGGRWIVLDDTVAREKVGHAIRDALAAGVNKKSKSKTRSKDVSNLRISQSLIDSQNSVLALFREAVES